jgi:hypothetical protein
MSNYRGQKHAPSITNEAIKRAIARSGYLIEQRVADRLSRSGYYVSLNPVFPDPFTTGKTREIDIEADSTYVSPSTRKGFITGIHWSIVCECENNLQPIVFFPYETLDPKERYSLIKCFGVPMKIWNNDEYVDFRLFLPFGDFHHYCSGQIATQYCSLRAIKKGSDEDWIAEHGEEQHDTFNSLISFIQYEIDDVSKDWDLPKNDEEEPLYIEFRYPLIVLGGKLKEASLGIRGMVLKKAHHIKYLKTAYFGAKQENYIIDVITEDYLAEYITLIGSEMKRVRRMMTTKKKEVNKSILQILQEARATDSPTDAYRRLIHPG